MSPSAQLAEQTPPQPAARSSQQLPYQESFSVAEAARLIDQAPGVLRMLCRRDAVPNFEQDGERRIKRADLLAYQTERDERLHQLRNSPFRKAMDAINAELLKDGLYWRGDPNINTRLPQ